MTATGDGNVSGLCEGIGTEAHVPGRRRPSALRQRVSCQEFLYRIKATRWRGSRAARPPTRPALGSATASRPATSPRTNSTAGGRKRGESRTCPHCERRADGEATAGSWPGRRPRGGAVGSVGFTHLPGPGPTSGKARPEPTAGAAMTDLSPAGSSAETREIPPTRRLHGSGGRNARPPPGAPGARVRWGAVRPPLLADRNCPQGPITCGPWQRRRTAPPHSPPSSPRGP